MVMNQKKTFSLGEFSSDIELFDSTNVLLDGIGSANLLITDSQVWKCLPETLPELAQALSQRPKISEAADIDALKNSAAQSDGDTAQVPSAIVILPAGEGGKNFASVELILKTAFALGFARDSCFIGLGGGAVTDVAAFASSLFLRGNRLVLIPSTLLAMVDASFGGKTGINYFGYKNMVGTFYPAAEVRVCPALLASLTQREYLSGLVEVIKSAMLDDAELFSILETEKNKVIARDPSLLSLIIWRSLMVKGRIVEADLRESGIRAHLNLGHTFAHALEALSGVESGGGKRAWTHGEAVAWGIVRALKLGILMGQTEGLYAQRVENLLRDYGYRLDKSGFDAPALISAMKNDKKKQAGQVRFVLQKDLCQTFRSPADDGLLEQAVN